VRPQLSGQRTQIRQFVISGFVDWEVLFISVEYGEVVVPIASDGTCGVAISALIWMAPLDSL
jgi:hypothetical protein